MNGEEYVNCVLCGKKIKETEMKTVRLYPSAFNMYEEYTVCQQCFEEFQDVLSKHNCDINSLKDIQKIIKLLKET